MLRLLALKKMFKIFEKYPEVFIAFSEKKHGSMKIVNDSELMRVNEANRQKFFKANNIRQNILVSAEIVHGNEIDVVKKTGGGKVVKNADGLITQSKELYLSITSADCLPIFLFEPKKEIVGMIHAGWRSLEKNILANAVGKIKEIGGKTENILAGIGPAICQKHYEIGKEVASKFEKYPGVVEKENKKLFLDIKKIAEIQFLELGLNKYNIEISLECTFELPEKYFSARRDKKKEIEAMMAVIGMNK